MTPLELLISRLPGVKKSGNGWSARCPAHDDRHASLSIAQGNDGAALVKCHAGCSAEAVVRAVGLELRDLFPRQDALTPSRNSKAPAGRQTFATVEGAIAELERRHGRRSAMWTYHDVENRPVGVVVRWDGPHGKDIRPISRHGDGWRIGAMPDPRPLYGLPRLAAAERVVVCEGEKAADAARSLGFVATTSAGGSQAASKTDWRPLAGKEVWILPDNDPPGGKYAEDVAGILAKLKPAPTTRVVELPGLPDHGDLVDWIDAHGDAAEPAAMRAEIEALAQAMEPWRPAVGGNPVLLATPTVRLADVETEAVAWLWPDRIPLGCVALICGRPGIGKSFLICDLSARVSAGLLLPDGTPASVGDVVLIAAEDDPARTLRPRCEAAGADLRRIRVVATPTWSMADLGNLERTLDGLPEARLIVLDPITHYLPGRMDLNRDNEMREALSGLATLAKERNLAVVLIAHNRKAAVEYADDSILGSRALSALPRAVHHILFDPDNYGRRLFLAGKNNLAAPPTGLAYCIGGHPPKVEWEPSPVQLRADDVIRRHQASEQPGPEPQARNAAEGWLRELLGLGPVPVGQVRAEAKAAGLSWITVRRAAEALGVRHQRQGFGPGGAWAWRLPEETS